jgi:hypothetical protein
MGTVKIDTMCCKHITPGIRWSRHVTKLPHRIGRRASSLAQEIALLYKMKVSRFGGMETSRRVKKNVSELNPNDKIFIDKSGNLKYLALSFGGGSIIRRNLGERQLDHVRYRSSVGTH